jgi:hypothetical protein
MSKRVKSRTVKTSNGYAKVWFTITFQGPADSCNLTGVKTTHDGSFIAWDGLSTYPEVMREATRLASKCSLVRVFYGKEIGRLHAEFQNGILVS